MLSFFGQVFRACSKSFVAQVAEIVEAGECDDSWAGLCPEEVCSFDTAYRYHLIYILYIYVILCHIIYHITRNLYCWIKLIKNRCRFHPFLSILRVFSQDLAFWPGEKLYSQYEEEPQIAANMLMIVMHISWLSDIVFLCFSNSKSLKETVSMKWVIFARQGCSVFIRQGDMMYFIRAGRVRLEANSVADSTWFEFCGILW